MGEHNHEAPVEQQEHEEHPGCKCGGVCKITGDCGKHLIKGDRPPGVPGGADEE